MISLVDAFDAMSTDRPYRAALRLDETVARLARGAGVQFDPEITRVFVSLLEQAGARFVLSTPEQRAA